MECNNELGGKGLPYPRTCRACGLGPCKKWLAMTDTPTSPVQPVRAWAVVDKDGTVDVRSITYHEERGEHTLTQLDRLFPTLAPFRVIHVEIREVNDE